MKAGDPLPARRVAAALERLPGFATAEFAGLLSDGPTAVTCRLRHRGHDLVLRIDKPGARRLGLDRVAELAALREAAAAGLAPRPLAADPAAGLLISEFIPGRNPGRDEFASEAFLYRLGKLLGRVHRLPARDWRRTDLVQVSDTYCSAGGGRRAAALAAEIRAMLAELPPVRPDCPCHNDLHPANVLELDGRLLLLDWEYAGVGNPLFELAALLRHNALPAAAAASLLGGAGVRLTPDASSQLAGWCRVYDRLAELWQRAIAAGDAGHLSGWYSQDRY